MLLTDAQLQEIREIIRDHHLAFVASTISPDAVAPEILERLKEMGLVDVKIASIKDAYLYGQVLGALDSTKGMSYEQFRDHVRSRPVALTEIERGAISAAQQSAGQYAVGLGNKIEVATNTVILDADADLRSRMRTEIRDLTAENIARRESIGKLKSNLGWATRDWARDWDRIAATETHTAAQRGQADHIAKRYGEDALVFVRPSPNACKHCLRLYLGPDGHPHVFKLSTLEANGTNFGKKTADWLPILPSAHPNGQCQLNRMPVGWGFDEHGRLSPKGKGGIEYEGEDDLQKAFKLQGHTEFQGIPIAIENKPGSVRRWKSPDGEGGSTRMKFAYGYVKRTSGADGDEIDCFLGPDPKAAMVYVIHQQDPKTGRYDEDKAMIGFSNQKLAESAYHDHYDSPDFFITTSPMSVDHFKRWVMGTVTQFVIPGEKAVVEPRLVLAKAQIATDIAAATSPAAGRAPGPGSVANFVFSMPKKQRPVTVLPEDMMSIADLDRGPNIKLDKETFEFQAPFHREPQMMIIPMGDGLDSDEVERNRKKLDEIHRGNIGEKIQMPVEAPS